MKTITIINQFSGNKGDRAICYFLLREILKKACFNIILSTDDRKNWINEKIIQNNNIKLIPWGWNIEGFNAKSRIDWERRRFFVKIGLPYLIHRVNNSKNGLGLAKLFVNKEFKESIEKSDLVISTGGHHLTTKFSPDCHNEQLFDLAAATLLDRELILWSQTFGPFDFNSESNKNAVYNILSKTSRIWVRDIKSFEVLEAMHINGSHIKKTHESVIGLNAIIKDYILPCDRENLVGITIYNAEKRTDFEYQQYCNTIAQISDWLIEKAFKIKFFSHEIKGDVADDRNCINDILNLILKKEQVIIEQEDLTTEDHLKEIMKCKLFVGHKTHSIIFALTAGTPVIAISYHSKIYDFMKEYGLEKNVINDNELGLDKFISTFNSISNNLNDIGLQEFEKSCLYAQSIQDDFKEELLRLQ